VQELIYAYRGQVTVTIWWEVNLCMSTTDKITKQRTLVYVAVRLHKDVIFVTILIIEHILT